MNLFNMWLFKTCFYSLLLICFTICIHYVCLMLLFTPYCLSIQNSLLEGLIHLNQSPLSVLTRLHLICTCSQRRFFFMNLLKENIKVSRQNNNDAPQTYIFGIKTCRLLPYTFSESYMAIGINPLSTVF